MEDNFTEDFAQQLQALRVYLNEISEKTGKTYEIFNVESEEVNQGFNRLFLKLRANIRESGSEQTVMRYDSVFGPWLQKQGAPMVFNLVPIIRNDLPIRGWRQEHRELLEALHNTIIRYQNDPDLAYSLFGYEVGDDSYVPEPPSRRSIKSRFAAGENLSRQSQLEILHERMSIPIINVPFGTRDAITGDEISENFLLADIVHSNTNGTRVYESTKNNYFLFPTVKDLYIHSYPNPFSNYPIEPDYIRFFRAHMTNVQGSRKRQATKKKK